MLTITGLLDSAGACPFILIVGYVIYRGGSTLNLDFFTQLARPLGMAGGGVLFSIEGTAVFNGPILPICYSAWCAGRFLCSA